MRKFIIEYTTRQKKIIHADSRSEAVENLKEMILFSDLIINLVEELNPTCKQCKKKYKHKKTDNRGKKREFCSTKCKSHYWYNIRKERIKRGLL